MPEPTITTPGRQPQRPPAPNRVHTGTPRLPPSGHHGLRGPDGAMLRGVCESAQVLVSRWIELSHAHVRAGCFDMITYGSARTPQDSPHYARTREESRLLAGSGIPTHAGGALGIMQAASHGVNDVIDRALATMRRAQNRLRSLGIATTLTNEPHNTFCKVIKFEELLGRLFAFLSIADGFNCEVGGPGTLLEGTLAAALNEGLVLRTHTALKGPKGAGFLSSYIHKIWVHSSYKPVIAAAEAMMVANELVEAGHLGRCGVRYYDGAADYAAQVIAEREQGEWRDAWIKLQGRRKPEEELLDRRAKTFNTAFEAYRLRIGDYAQHVPFYYRVALFGASSITCERNARLWQAGAQLGRFLAEEDIDLIVTSRSGVSKAAIGKLTEDRPEDSTNRILSFALENWRGLDGDDSFIKTMPGVHPLIAADLVGVHATAYVVLPGELETFFQTAWPLQLNQLTANDRARKRAGGDPTPKIDGRFSLRNRSATDAGHLPPIILVGTELSELKAAYERYCVDHGTINAGELDRARLICVPDMESACRLLSEDRDSWRVAVATIGEEACN